MPTNLLFLSYGNPLRGDDAAGLELARRVCAALGNAQFSIRLLETQQLLPELINEISDPSLAALFFFDCRVERTGDGIEVSALSTAMIDVQPATLGHHLTPQTLLAIAAALYGRLPPAWLVTIPGYSFGVGEGLSEEVQQLLVTAADIAQQVIMLCSET